MDNLPKLLETRRRAASLLPLVVLWGVMVAGGYFALVRYAATPGNARNPPKQMPTDMDRVLVDDQPVLFVFIHPLCPCSSATVAELERLLTEVNTPLTPIILLGCPESEQQAWTQTPLARRCQMTVNATVVIDRDGELANRLNATTSGFCVLYSKDGELLFHGGITSGRGHEGESLGRVAIRDILNGRVSVNRQTPVFGCELVGNSPAAEQTRHCCNGKASQ
jgi:hypothetical protein